VKLLVQYTRTFGNDPELLQLIARAYQKLGDTIQAATWYDRFIAHFPTHRDVPGTLWKRAWME